MTQPKPEQIKTLAKKIKAGRRKLTNLWRKTGFTDAKVLAASIELDQ